MSLNHVVAAVAGNLTNAKFNNLSAVTVDIKSTTVDDLIINDTLTVKGDIEMGLTNTDAFFKSLGTSSFGNYVWLDSADQQLMSLDNGGNLHVETGNTISIGNNSSASSYIKLINGLKKLSLIDQANNITGNLFANDGDFTGNMMVGSDTDNNKGLFLRNPVVTYIPTILNWYDMGQILISYSGAINTGTSPARYVRCGNIVHLTIPIVNGAVASNALVHVSGIPTSYNSAYNSNMLVPIIHDGTATSGCARWLSGVLTISAGPDPTLEWQIGELIMIQQSIITYIISGP